MNSGALISEIHVGQHIPPLNKSDLSKAQPSWLQSPTVRAPQNSPGHPSPADVSHEYFSKSRPVPSHGVGALQEQEVKKCTGLRLSVISMALPWCAVASGSDPDQQSCPTK